MADFDTDFRHNAICPHCGYEHEDSWEFYFGPGLEGDGRVDCRSCCEPFMCTRNVEITYSTNPIKEPAAPEGGNHG